MGVVASRTFQVTVNLSQDMVKAEKNITNWLQYPDWLIDAPAYLKLDDIKGLPISIVRAAIQIVEVGILKEWGITEKIASKLWPNWCESLSYTAGIWENLVITLDSLDKVFMQHVYESIQTELASGHKLYQRKGWWELEAIGITDIKHFTSDIVAHPTGEVEMKFVYEAIGYTGKPFFTALSKLYPTVEFDVECLDDELQNKVKIIYKGGQADVYNI